MINISRTYIFGALIYLTMMPASLKIFIGTSFGNIVNILVFLLLITFLILRNVSNASKKIKIFNFFIFSIFSIFSIYFLFDLYNISDASLRYYVKASYLILSSYIIIRSCNEHDIHYFINVAKFFGIAVAIKAIGMNNEFDMVGINYLTISMPVLISYCLILLNLKLNKKIYFYIPVIFIMLYVLLTSQSRSAFILCLIFSFFILIVKGNAKFNNVLKYWYLILISMAVASSSFLLQLLEKYNYVIYARIMRNFIDIPGIPKEDRVTIYGDAFSHILDLNHSLLGYGFSSAKELFNLPYIESFIMEYVLNFGFFGLLISIVFIILFVVLFVSFFQQKNDSTSKELSIIYILMFFFFIKGWSVYDSIVILIPLSLYILHGELRNVFDNNTNI